MDSIPPLGGATSDGESSQPMAFTNGAVSNLPPVGREAVLNFDFRVPILKRGRLVGYASGSLLVEHLPSLLNSPVSFIPFARTRRGKSRQDKTRPRHDTTRHDKTRQDKISGMQHNSGLEETHAQLTD
jgi:hypothetical protein